MHVEIRLDDSVHLKFKDAYLNYKTIPKRPYKPFLVARPSGTKQYDDPRIKGVGPKPAKDHPWRRSYKDGPYRAYLPAGTVNSL